MRKNLVLLGMMGVGKTTLARLTAEKSGLKLIDTDSIIEKKNLMSIRKIFEKKGENFFRQEEEEITLNSLNDKNCVIALGGGAFINKKIRERVLSSSISIWLEIEPNLLNERMKNKHKRPLLKNNSNKKRISEIYNKRKNIYNLAHHKIKCDKLSKGEVLKKIISIYEDQ